MSDRVAHRMCAIVMGTFDTKAEALGLLADALRARDIDVLSVDVGTHDSGVDVDVPRIEVIEAARALGLSFGSAPDRRQSLDVMASGAERVVGELVRSGRIDGIIAAGGAGNSELAGRVMQSMPLGLPKVLISTLASGNTRPLIGGSDIWLVNPVVDVAAANFMLRRALTSGAAVLSALMTAAADTPSAPRRLVYTSMFGITTPCVDSVSRRLRDRGMEVLAFHATGVGGQSLENMIRTLRPDAVVEVTTTEWADEVVGGVCSAGPHRLESAGHLGVPQIVVPGALDTVNFGPPDSVPPRYRDRLLHRHASAVTLMRTNVEESVEIARNISDKLNAATGPVTVVLPLGGVSALDAPGEPFWDPAVDEVLFEELRSRLIPTVRVIESPHHINDEAFAQAVVDELDVLVA